MRAADLLLLVVLAFPGAAWAADVPTMPWWIWPIALFAVTFVLGIVAILSGIGGGVLFVPFVGGFFPFHVDFVRGAALLLALSGALAASPALLRNGLASLRVTMPLALAGSVGSISGAMIGLALPAAVVNTTLGAVVLLIATYMMRAELSERPRGGLADAWSAALGLHGVFHDAAAGDKFDWNVHRTPAGLAAFGGIGLMGGMFGLGAGWANVPALNLLMGVPLKLAVGTSGLAISIINSAAAWVYIDRGAVLPVLAVPSILGIMVGARIGGRMLRTAHASTVRRLVLASLFVAGGRALAKGLGIWN